jgi:hypothetical protein
MKILLFHSLLALSLLFSGCFLNEGFSPGSSEDDLSKEDPDAENEDEGMTTDSSDPSQSAPNTITGIEFGGGSCSHNGEEVEGPPEETCEALAFDVPETELELDEGKLTLPEDSISCPGYCALTITFSTENYVMPFDTYYRSGSILFDFNNERVTELGLESEVGIIESVSIEFDTWDVENYPDTDDNKSYHLTLEKDLTLSMDAEISDSAVLETPQAGESSDTLKWFAFCYELRNNIDENGHSLGDSTGVFYNTYFHVISEENTSYDEDRNQLELNLTAGQYDPSIVHCGAISYVEFSVAGVDEIVYE